MDFHALPRRDLQALCKRNGVRANMTNAAMADALGALHSVDGIEEYIKQPAAVPEPAGKVAVAEEAVRPEKQGSPLPHGRRVTAKAVKPDEGMDKEGEKTDAKRGSNREEDAPELGLGRRGASRRARPAPLVAALAAEPAEKPMNPAPRATRPAPVVAAQAAETAAKMAAEKPGNPPPRAGRKPARPDDGVEKEDLKREANKEEAPVQGAVRRGPSRRARAAHVLAASAAELETKAAAEEEKKQASPLPRARHVTSKLPELARPDDRVDEEDTNWEKRNDDAPAQGVGRRGPSRRARAAPVISEPAAKAVVEELGSPPPRGRRVTVNVKLSVPVSTEGGEKDEKEDMRLEANKGIAPALVDGRRGARGRARPEPAVSAPVDEVPAEEDAPIPRGRRGKGKAPEPIRLNSGEDEDKEELKLEEKEEDAPAHGVARPARVRKPTMKAAEAEEKVPRRTTKKAAATNATLQNEKLQEELQEAVPALDSVEACCDLEYVEEAADHQNVEHSEVIGGPKQEDEEVLMNKDELRVKSILVRPTRVRNTTMKAAAAAEEKVPRRRTKKAAAMNSTLQKKQQEEPQESVPALASDEACYDLENLEETADLQNVEQSEMINEPKQEHEVDLMDEDEMLMEMTPSDEPTLTEEMYMEESLQEEPPVIDQECTDNSAIEEQECKDKSPVEEQQVDVEPCATLPSLEDSPILGLVSMFAEHTVENDDDEGDHFQEGSGPSEGRLDEENHNDGKEIETVPIIQTLQAPLIAADPATEVGSTGHAGHADRGSEMESSNSLQGTEENTTVNDEDGPVCQEKGDVADYDDAEAQPKTVDEAVAVHCSGNITSVVEEKAEEAMVSELVQNQVVISNNVTQLTQIDGKSAGMEKAELVTEQLTQGSAQLDADVEEDNFQTYFVHVNEVKEVVGMHNAETIADELLQSISIMYEDVGKDSFQTDFTLVGEQNLAVDGEKTELVTDKLSVATRDKDVGKDSFHSDFYVEKAQLVTDKLPQSTTTTDEDVEEDFQTDSVHVKEQKEITSADWVQEVIMNARIVVDKVLITKEMQQSTSTMYEKDVADNQLETDFVLAKKQTDGTTADKPKLTGTYSEVNEEEKAIEVTEEMDELNKVVTAENVLGLSETEDDDVRNKNAFNGDLPRELDIARDYTDSITSALLDDITETLSKITITEPTGSRNEKLPICKNSSENTAEQVCKYRSEKNTDEFVCEKSEKNKAELVAMQENMGLKVAKKSADLNKLTLGQLRTKLKKALERKKEKRVPLARVDENVCRSNATGQEQVGKPQQY